MWLHDLRARNGVNGILGMCVIANQTSNVRFQRLTKTPLRQSWQLQEVGWFCEKRIKKATAISTANWLLSPSSLCSKAQIHLSHFDSRLSWRVLFILPYHLLVSIPLCRCFSSTIYHCGAVFHVVLKRFINNRIILSHQPGRARLHQFSSVAKKEEHVLSVRRIFSKICPRVTTTVTRFQHCTQKRVHKFFNFLVHLSAIKVVCFLRGWVLLLLLLLH